MNTCIHVVNNKIGILLRVYNSIDRQALINVPEGLELDNNIRYIIKDTLLDTKSKVKFLSEISKPVDIKTC